MLNISQKKDLVEKFEKELSDSELVILINYKGLDVLRITELRALLREKGFSMKVVKNTLLRKASEGNDAFLLKDFYNQPNAVVLSKEDSISPAKILIDFAKDNSKLEIKAGVLDGKLLDPEEIKQLSGMSSREDLLSQLVYAMNAVPGSLANVLAAVPRSLVNVLAAVRDQKDAA